MYPLKSLQIDNFSKLAETFAIGADYYYYYFLIFCLYLDPLWVKKKMLLLFLILKLIKTISLLLQFWLVNLRLKFPEWNERTTLSIRNHTNNLSTKIKLSNVFIIIEYLKCGCHSETMKIDDKCQIKRNIEAVIHVNWVKISVEIICLNDKLKYIERFFLQILVISREAEFIGEDE